LGESRALNDHHAVHEEHLKDNDILLFVRKRKNHAPTSVAEKDLKSPTMAQIMEATKMLPSSAAAAPVPQIAAPGSTRDPQNSQAAGSNGRPESIFEVSYDVIFCF